MCGILDDVYVAPRCNARGSVYGFVQALNNVWFSDLRVWAMVARF